MSTNGSIDVPLPDLGDSVTEGVVVEWRVAIGDAVAAGDVLLDVTTDKVDVEVPAPEAGVVHEILASAGETIEVGQVLARLGESSDNGDAPADGGAITADAAAAPPTADAEAAPAASEEIVPIQLDEMESITEGVIVEWRVAVGGAVTAGDIVVEISTDKVDLEVPAPATGTLTSQAAGPGETFSVAEPLGAIVVGVGGASPAAPPAAEPPAAADEPTRERPAAPAGAIPEWPAISPLARAEALKSGIDLSKINGSGPGGMIRRGDLRSGGGGRPAPEIPEMAGEERVPLAGPAKALAGYMDDSLSIPTATSVRTLTVGVLEAQRAAINDALRSADAGVKLSFTHLIAWAIIRAAGEVPAMGTGYALVDDAPHKIVRGGVHLGLAVDVERKDGSRSLLVPVVRDADQMSFRDFVTTFNDLVSRTRDGGIKPDELRGASITLTNPGGLGTVASVPRLMPGQGTIVATGSIAYPPGLGRADAGSLGIDKVMTVTSTYDHRVIQGAESGAFLGVIDELLAGGSEFYEEIRGALGLPAAPPVELPAPSADVAPAVAPAPVAADGSAEITEDLVDAISAAMSVIKAHRTHGHLAASLDPLGATPLGDPALEPGNLGLTPERMRTIPAEPLRVYVPGETFADALPHLRETYCGSIAYEIEQIADHEDRVWLREAIESGRFREPQATLRRMEVLERLIHVDAFERFLRRTYLGQKTFSIEGIDALVPMIDEVIDLCAEEGAEEIMIAMAHRGRLSVMCHTIGRPLDAALAEFEGHMEFDEEEDDTDLGVRETAGDVKYHLGAEGTYTTRDGRAIRVHLAANPSHLEQVNPVLQGQTRARQTDRDQREILFDHRRAVPVLVHGDAAFPGQGVVSETLNLADLPGYTTGGTIHIIANNQIGFTTEPSDARSTRHASDLARGFDFPIIHVNADDIDACMSAVRLAIAWRERTGRDALIDLVGYRRFGHNELDEPAYTQPVMARTIKQHDPVSTIYAEKLISEGALTRDRLGEVIAHAEQRLAEAHARVRKAVADGTYEEPEEPDFEPVAPDRGTIRTAVGADELIRLNEELLALPEDLAIHPKLGPQLERRREAMSEEEPAIVWAHAEALAFASLLVEGVPIRMTGQDSQRGTFSQRHMVLHDMAEDESWYSGTGPTYTPMAELSDATAGIEIYNSPLSEAAVVGFEYGYSAEAPEALVLWEAQYGDFANGAQNLIDQFVVSAQVKWGQRSRLTMLLPHGYEGNGPEHSSARIERFLQAAGEDNIRVAYPSTAANYFHLLRKQALTKAMRPLIVFTPKSLLRQRSASSTLAELTEGTFATVLADPRAAGREEEITRLILGSGKICHDIGNHAARADLDHVAVGRIEMLYPFPEDQVSRLAASYPNLREVVWAQEEPRNMGAWAFVARRINLQLPEGLALEYAGRPRRASTSEGYPQAHQVEQERVIHSALGVEPPAA